MERNPNEELGANRGGQNTGGTGGTGSSFGSTAGNSGGLSGSAGSSGLEGGSAGTGGYGGSAGVGTTGSGLGSSQGGTQSGSQGGSGLADRAEHAGEKARDLAHDGKEKGRELMQEGKERAKEGVENVRERAGDLKARLADTLEAGAQKLRQRTQSGNYAGATGTGASASIASDDRMAQVSESVADGLHSSAEWVRETDLESLRRDVETQVQDHPGRTLLIAVGVGYLLGKALRR
jgi:ElaB/YqjD/DUF883 family membrane-anchored ribosome-binding protein